MFKYQAYIYITETIIIYLCNYLNVKQIVKENSHVKVHNSVTCVRKSLQNISGNPHILLDWYIKFYITRVLWHNFAQRIKK